MAHCHHDPPLSSSSTSGHVPRVVPIPIATIIPLSSVVAQAAVSFASFPLLIEIIVYYVKFIAP
jgi:hypothetical protein